MVKNDTKLLSKYTLSSLHYSLTYSDISLYINELHNRLLVKYNKSRYVLLSLSSFALNCYLMQMRKRVRHEQEAGKAKRANIITQLFSDKSIV